jgi:hypothetical protein
MPVPNSPSLVASLLRSLDPALIGIRHEEEPGPAMRPVPAPAEAQAGPDFKATVRANIHAAAQHVMRGHKAASFRECSRPSCRNASNLIPYPVVVKAGATDAELEAIFQRVVTAALEEVATHPIAAETSHGGWDEPAFVS